MLKGTISYDDGFPEHVGDKITSTFCQTYFIFRGKHTSAGRGFG
jgi:hypothetical protein